MGTMVNVNALLLSPGRMTPMVFTGKKLARVPVACSDELKAVVGRVAHLRNVSVSELCHRYLEEGLARDIGEAVLASGVRAGDLRM